MPEHSGDGAVAEFQAPDYLFFVRGSEGAKSLVRCLTPLPNRMTTPPGAEYPHLERRLKLLNSSKMVPAASFQFQGQQLASHLVGLQFPQTLARVPEQFVHTARQGPQAVWPQHSCQTGNQ